MEKIYKFKTKQVVDVTSSGKDPGGRGTITARKSEDFEGGPGVDNRYRVDIADHEGQRRARARRGKAHKGFWYPEKLLSAVEE